MNYIEQKVWSDSHSSVWKEIVSRFGQSEYDDEARRTIHTAALKEEYDSLTYSRNRATEYPSIADQLDDIYHNGIDAWKATIKVTKDKYPK
tara:strand:+ start:504 stop:776 length:273 start_codon:yes stop_codon:yes gene_type:complete